MDNAMSAALMADFADEQVCYLPKTWCKACGEATKANRRPSACGQNGHEVKPCPKCRTRITTAHVDLDYVGHADVRARLCEVDPEWTWAPYLDFPGGAVVATPDGHPFGLWILLTVGGVTKPGYGSCEKGKPEAVKELIGDALRNAALSFGVGWKLWAKGDRSGQEGDRAASHAEPPVPAAAHNGKPRTRAKVTGAEHERLRNGTVERTPDDRPAARGQIPPAEDKWTDQPPGPFDASLVEPEDRPASSDGKQRAQIIAGFNALGVKDRTRQLVIIEQLIGHPLAGPERAEDGSDRTRKNLSWQDAKKVLKELEARREKATGSA